jgi:hypothetical protein
LASLSDGFLAAAYLSNFIVYLISVIETIAYLAFRFHKPEFMMFWEGTIAYWGSLILYPIPLIFLILHMVLPKENGGLNFETHAPLYTNDLILLVAGITFWLGIGSTHILFTQRFMNYAFAKIALEENGCICLEPPETTEVCQFSCPPDDYKCPLVLSQYKDDREYYAACAQEAILVDNMQDMQTDK